MPGCLIQSDTESLLRGEVSMSGRSSQGIQTVDKIFNVSLQYHRSNNTEKLEFEEKALRFQRRFTGLRDLFKYDLIDSSAPCVRFMGNGMDFLPGKHGANVHKE